MGFNYCYLCSSRVLVTWIFADLNALSTNVWFNIIFFVLLVVFAASFLGAFEIMLPNSWANKVDSQQIEEELLDFIYGIGTCNCIFSCTGPIVGTLLVEAASKGAPIIGFFIGISFTLCFSLCSQDEFST
jgi:thiol:disulfide interchange protein DsbD